MYGVLLAIGVLVATFVGERRWRNRGYERDGIYDIAFWVVIAGVIGARLYHVITDYQLFERRPAQGVRRSGRAASAIWGAVIGGAIAVDRRHAPPAHGPRRPRSTAIAPGLAFAQAIGRWGNWFNQELFGEPTTLPWGLEIVAGAPADRLRSSTRRSSRRSSTSRCGASRSGSRAAAASTSGSELRRGQLFALYVRGLHGRPVPVRGDAHRPCARPSGRSG